MSRFVQGADRRHPRRKRRSASPTSAAYAAQQQLVMTRLSQQTNLVELYRALGGELQ